MAGASVEPATVRQGDREKAYRPIARAERRAALQAALAAWTRDDWFEAHELLEPAWMGTDDPLERDLYQGLIKLAAAYVHAARGNATGMAKGLAGARARLRRVTLVQAAVEGIDVRGLLADVEARIPAEGLPANLRTPPPVIPAVEES